MSKKQTASRAVRTTFTELPWFLIPLLIGAAAVVIFLTSSSKTTKRAVACNQTDLSGEFKPEKIAYFDGNKVNVPEEESGDTSFAQVLGETSGGGERLIEVDLSEQKLIAHEGDQIFLETQVASGLPWTPTPEGEFRVWGKFRYTKMEGGSGKYYYNLPNVPYVMFFENPDVPGYKGYGLHGTYWHNSFGTPRSHGCVNLPTPIAKELFYWTGPTLPEGKGTTRATSENPGTRIVIHE